MKLYQRFLTLSRGKQIVLVVCLIHLLAIFGLLGHHLVNWRSRSPKPILVRTQTVTVKREMQTAKVESKILAPAAAKPKEPVKKPAPAKPKPTAHQKSAPKQSPVAKKTSENPLLKEISESLEVLSAEVKRSKPALTLPSKVPQKAQIAQESAGDPTYGEFLIAYLQNALDLPEYGDVRVEIEIDRWGKLVRCKILDARSKKNGEFLQNQLPNLTFPCLNDFGILDTRHTFTIVFRNVETR